MWKLILEFIRTLIVSIVFILFVVASVALLAWIIKEVLV